MIDHVIFAIINILIYIKHPFHIKKFRRRVGYFPNIAFPKRYNEIMLWRKVFDHNPLFTTFSDKLATKAFQRDRCPGLNVLQPLWTGDDCTTIPASVMGQACVIKANHGSGWNYFNRPDHQNQVLPAGRINGWRYRTYGARNLEWGYLHAAKMLFCEEWLDGPGDDGIVELSVHAGGGVAFILEAIAKLEDGQPRKAYFGTDGRRNQHVEKNLLPHEVGKYLPADYALPSSHKDALEHARHLSAGVDYARFDFILQGDQLFGGEITVYPGSGLTNHIEFENYNGFMEQVWDISKAEFFSATHGTFMQIYARYLQKNLRLRDEAK